ncbi:unnamed protein product [Aphanomyces euteiches]
MAPLVYLITGANKGIGYETVRILAERLKDQAIVLLGTRSVDNGKAAIAKMKQTNPSFDYANVQVVEIDVAKKASIQAAADHVKAAYGSLHVLVNNAGITGFGGDKAECFQVNVPNQSFNIVVGSIVGSWTFGDLPPELQAIFEDFTAVDTAAMQNLIDDWLVYAEEKPCQHPWPAAFPAFVPYEISKMMAMAVGRKWAAEHPDIKTTVVCPGYCATDLNHHSGVRTAAQGAESILFPIFHDELTKSGGFYNDGVELPYKAIRPAMP